MAYEEDIASWLEQAREMSEKTEETLSDGRKPMEVAEQLIERCLRYDAANGNALSAWVDLYVRTGRGPLVMKRLQKIIRDVPTAIGPYRAVSAFLRITGKLDLAIQYFQDALQQAEPSLHSVLHLCLSELYACKGNLAALRLSRVNITTVIDPIMQGMLFLEDNDVQGLLQLSEKLTDNETMKYTVWGMMAEAQGDLDNAGKYFFHVSEQEDANWYAYNTLAQMWLQHKNVEYTLAYLESAEALAPNAPEIRLTRARYYQLNEQPEKAKPIKEKLLSLEGCFSRTRKMAQRHLW